jgi:hypothetical protein
MPCRPFGDRSRSRRDPERSEPTMPTATMTEEERQARREADRQRTREAVEALRASDGWQQWLRLRRHFRAYSPLI